MSLHTAPHPVHHIPVALNGAAGIGVLRTRGESRRTSSVAAFLRLVMPMGGPDGAPQGAPVPRSRYANPFGPSTLIGVVVDGSSSEPGTTTMNTLIPVSFRNTTLTIIDHAGEPHVAMRPIVTGMGLRWEAQTVKLNTHKSRWGVSIIETPSSGGRQKSLCMPLRKLPGWLATIHPDKVRPELRDTIIAYQNECDDVLWEHWNKSSTARATAPKMITKQQHDLPAPPAFNAELQERIHKRAGALSGLHYTWCVEQMNLQRHLPPVCFNPDTWTPEPHTTDVVNDLEAALRVMEVFGKRLGAHHRHLVKLSANDSQSLSGLVAAAKAKRAQS